MKIREPKVIGKILNQTEIGKELQRQKNWQKKQPARTIKKKSQVAPVEQNVMEFSSIFATTPEDRKRGWFKIGLKNGKYAEIRAVIPKDGKQPDLIQEGDLDIFLLCFLMAKDKKDYIFETSNYAMASLLEGGEKGPPKSGYDRTKTKNALRRLASNLITTNFWFNTINGERIIRNNFHFLDSLGEGKEDTYRIRLSKDIVKSLRRGYRKSVDLEKVFHLRGYAKFLCLYLMKRIGAKKEFEHNLDTILRLLGLEKKYKKLPPKYFNRNVKKFIIPAMEKASETIGFHCEYKKEERKFCLHKSLSIAHKEK